MKIKLKNAQINYYKLHALFNYWCYECLMKAFDNLLFHFKENPSFKSRKSSPSKNDISFSAICNLLGIANLRKKKSLDNSGLEFCRVFSVTPQVFYELGRNFRKCLQNHISPQKVNKKIKVIKVKKTSNKKNR